MCVMFWARGSVICCFILKFCPGVFTCVLLVNQPCVYSLCAPCCLCHLVCFVPPSHFLSSRSFCRGLFSSCFSWFVFCLLIWTLLLLVTTLLSCCVPVLHLGVPVLLFILRLACLLSVSSLGPHFLATCHRCVQHLADSVVVDSFSC